MSNDECTIMAAGYVPLDIVSYNGRTWHSAGGTAGNVAAILGFLGWTAYAISDVGDDLAGRRIRRDLQSSNVSVRYLRMLKNFESPRVLHDISETGHIYRFKCPQCTRSLPMSRPISMSRAAEILETATAPSVFFFDRINAGTLRLAEKFKAEGSRIFLEPSRDARPEYISRALAVADVVKVADDRVGAFHTFDASSRKQLWIITSGFKGAKFRLGNGIWHESAAYKYPVIDAGGAGDWTSAGLINSFQNIETLKLQNIASALTWAQALAAVSCGVPGARGLAKRQSAESVIKAAQFLQSKGEEDSISVKSKEVKIRNVGAPDSTCRCCLQEWDEKVLGTGKLGESARQASSPASVRRDA